MPLISIYYTLYISCCVMKYDGNRQIANKFNVIIIMCDNNFTKTELYVWCFVSFVYLAPAKNHL